MVIQGDFFRITPSSESSIHFDLELLYKIKGKNPREEYKNAGYGMPLETASATRTVIDPSRESPFLT